MTRSIDTLTVMTLDIHPVMTTKSSQFLRAEIEKSRRAPARILTPCARTHAHTRTRTHAPAHSLTS